MHLALMLPTLWVETYVHSMESSRTCQHGVHDPEFAVGPSQSGKLYFLQVSHGNLVVAKCPMVSVIAQVAYSCTQVIALQCNRYM
jgi:hypothetical protein